MAGGKNILHGVNGWKRCLPWNAPGEDGGNVVNRHLFYNLCYIIVNENKCGSWGVLTIVKCCKVQDPLQQTWHLNTSFTAKPCMTHPPPSASNRMWTQDLSNVPNFILYRFNSLNATGQNNTSVTLLDQVTGVGLLEKNRINTHIKNYSCLFSVK